MKTDIVIVNYHGGQQLYNYVQKLSKFKSVNRICLVNNDVHEDEKTEITRSIKSEKVKLIFNEFNLGFAAGVNQGIAQLLKNNCEFALLLNPDTDIDNSKIEKLLSKNFDVSSPVLKFKRKGVDVYDFGGVVNFVIGRTKHLETTDYIPASQKSGLRTTSTEIDYVSGACMLIKKEVFRKIGMFDERFFMYFEDVDFCLRAKNTDFSVVTNSEVVVDHKISEHKFTKNRFKIKLLLKSNYLFIRKWIRWYLWPISYVYLFFLIIKSTTKYP